MRFTPLLGWRGNTTGFSVLHQLLVDCSQRLTEVSYEVAQIKKSVTYIEIVNMFTIDHVHQSRVVRCLFSPYPPWLQQFVDVDEVHPSEGYPYLIVEVLETGFGHRDSKPLLVVPHTLL